MSIAHQTYTYQCVNKNCHNYHNAFEAMSPAEVRATTGDFVRCDQCGEIVRLTDVKTASDNFSAFGS